MGKIISNFFISLDDVVEAPNEWHFPYFDEKMGEAVGTGFNGTDAMLMGHQLYREWSEYWPQQPDDVPFADVINPIAKYVIASEDFTPTWNNTTVLSGPDLADQVRALKERTDGKISMSGSATTVRWLLAEGLLDELQLLMHPIAVGHGARLFGDGTTHPLELVSHEVFPTGVLHLVYAPTTPPAD